ncbi:MAG: type II CAAX endopeptidase family protein [Bacilli bacterium]|jgi:hypothetical protein
MNKYLKSLLVVIYYLIYNIAVYIPFVILNVEIRNIPDFLFYTYYISIDIILIASLFYIYKKDLKKYLYDFKRNGKFHLKESFNYWIIGLAIMISSNIIISLLAPISTPENEQMIRQLIKICPWFIAFTTIIEAPIVEEIIFRKVPFDVIKNKTLYIIISGLLFGAVHIIGSGTSLASWLYIIPYSALGMSFAYMYVKTNNLLTSMCFHAFHNFITVIQILLLL